MEWNVASFLRYSVAGPSLLRSRIPRIIIGFGGWKSVTTILHLKRDERTSSRGQINWQFIVGGGLSASPRVFVEKHFSLHKRRRRESERESEKSSSGCFVCCLETRKQPTTRGANNNKKTAFFRASSLYVSNRALRDHKHYYCVGSSRQPSSVAVERLFGENTKS